MTWLLSWPCGAFQPTYDLSLAYRCTRKWGHLGPHEAEDDEGETLAEWPRRQDPDEGMITDD